MKLFTFLIQACILNATVLLGYNVFKANVSPQHNFEVGDCIEYFVVLQVWDVGSNRVDSPPRPMMTGHTAKVLNLKGNYYSLEDREEHSKYIRSIDEADTSYAKINCDGIYP